MLSLLIFILILSVLVLVHEFGHFITAKKAGIKVEEFGLGIPPRIFGKQIGETIYSINLFPFGGFVRLKGEDTEEISEADLQDPRSFVSKSAGQRALILSAGVLMNILFGAFVFYVLLFANGFKSLYIPLIFDHNFKFGNIEKLDTVIFGFSKTSPLKKKDVELGQAITQISGRPVNSIEDVHKALEGTAGKNITIKIKDIHAPKSSGAAREIEVIPYKNEENNDVLGVYLGSAPRISYEKPLEKLFGGFLHSYNILDYSITGFTQLVRLSFQERSAAPISQSVSGPVGIYSVVDNIINYSEGSTFLNLLDLTGLISVSLALLNILPLPALDGGRVLFVLIEAIRGKRVSSNLEASIHKVGILVLLSLLVLVSVRDVSRLFL